ncbi:hypothetical protein TNCV_3941391 [Trichonephila clavipes]|uniref:Uncharacterized protein n=1 Tax=Trichonephila clavipes TaxID=2585209 RepID=A0A8X7B8L5_TRICX|nr:hypothetical protein TNCV_3941391 [Trichonephila clavipes]
MNLFILNHGQVTRPTSELPHHTHGRMFEPRPIKQPLNTAGLQGFELMTRRPQPLGYRGDVPLHDSFKSFVQFVQPVGFAPFP